MRVAIITTLFNKLELTQAMWRSLPPTMPAGLEWEMIFFDNASTDGTGAWLDTLPGKNVRHLSSAENLGFACGNNRAARATDADILILLNNDTELLPGWLEPMLQAFQSAPRVGVVGNLQLSHGTRELDHRGVLFDVLKRPCHDRRKRPLPALLKAYSRYPAVTAACCAIRRETFLAVGGFDEAYRNGYEDIDLCLRLAQRGYRHYVANRSVILHHVSASESRFERETDNLHLFLSRWGPPPEKITYRRGGLAYLQRYWKQPWRYNGPKLLLALAWLLTNHPLEKYARKTGLKLPAH